MGAMSMVDSDRQWFKAALCVESTCAPRGDAFCAHLILQPDEMRPVLGMREDPCFHNHPFVLEGPCLRFRDGAPLVTSDGHVVRTFCLMDSTARHLTDDE